MGTPSSTFVINEPACSGCGSPVSYGCECHQTENVRGACSIEDGCGLFADDDDLLTDNELDAILNSDEELVDNEEYILPIPTMNDLGNDQSGSARWLDHDTDEESVTHHDDMMRENRRRLGLDRASDDNMLPLPTDNTTMLDRQEKRRKKKKRKCCKCKPTANASNRPDTTTSKAVYLGEDPLEGGY